MRATVAGDSPNFLSNFSGHEKISDINQKRQRDSNSIQSCKSFNSQINTHRREYRLKKHLGVQKYEIDYEMKL